MATWQEISEQMTAKGPTGPDEVRREKLRLLFEHTQRPIIMYAVEMFNGQKIAATGGDISIDLNDKNGFIEALRGITGPNLDVIIHSPGGSPEATESIVELLRSRFNNIRFLIPAVAKSAATMLAMSGEEIIIGDDAEVGPTDPQLRVNNNLHPVHAILRQFENAQKELAKNNSSLPAWLPILQQYGPSLLVQCQDAQALTKTLVKNWLQRYMFQGLERAPQKAASVSRFLGHKNHLSHGRAIPITELTSRGVKIKKASEISANFAELLQDINIAMLQTFAFTGAYKMFENHQGKGMFRVIQPQMPMQIPMMMQQPTKQ